MKFYYKKEGEQSWTEYDGKSDKTITGVNPEDKFVFKWVIQTPDVIFDTATTVSYGSIDTTDAKVFNQNSVQFAKSTAKYALPPKVIVTKIEPNSEQNIERSLKLDAFVAPAGMKFYYKKEGEQSWTEYDGKSDKTITGVNIGDKFIFKWVIQTPHVSFDTTTTVSYGSIDATDAKVFNQNSVEFKSNESKVNPGVIAGSVLGSVGGVGSLMGGGFLFFKKKKKNMFL